MIEHKPVMLAEVLEFLKCKEGDTIVDCTLGGGGHAEAILEQIGESGRLIGFDIDDVAVKAASKRLKHFSKRVIIIKERYEHVKEALSRLLVDSIDGALLDLGVSAYQLYDKSRGFSYMEESRLDMRMDKTLTRTAEDIVNDYSQEELTAIFKKYGGERWASRIAKFIIEKKRFKRIESTSELVDIIKAAIPASARRKGGHPARKVFQALRIEVNEEIAGIEETISSLTDMLNSGCRLVVISYHSLEDRIVKHTILKLSNSKIVKIITRRPVLPSRQEIIQNPRSRSAKLRSLEKIA